jgi:hypothetical protein
MPRSGRLIVALALTAGGMALAQEVVSAKAGMVYLVIGRISVEGSGRLAVGAPNRQLLEGETLFDESGRAALSLNPGTILSIGDATRVRMDNVDLTDTRVSLLTGSAVLTVNRAPKLDRVEIRIAGAIVVPKGDGVYRLDSNPARLRVYSGAAEVFLGSGLPKIIAKRGQSFYLQDLQLTRFDTDDADSLQLWGQKQTAHPLLASPLELGPGRFSRSPFAGFFIAGKAKTPYDLVRYVNGHVKFEWTPMGNVTGSAEYVLEDCGEYSLDCSAKLIDVPDSREEIVILRRGASEPMFLLYRRQTTASASWEFVGAYGVGNTLEPQYQVTRQGMKTYLVVTWRGTAMSGVDVESQDWIDLSSPRFEPALSLFTRLRFTDRREYETTASIVSWQTDPVETVQVEYRASAGQDDNPIKSRTVAATFVRQGDTFVLDPARSTLPQEARWGRFGVNGVRLLAP